MLGKVYDDEVCSAARALEVVGERWTLLILREAAFAGSRRYKDFQSRLKIASNILTNRLADLVDAGVMERIDGEYALTEKGLDFVPAIVALTQWGDKWNAPNGPPVYYTHKTCGGDVSAILVCDECGTVHERGDVQVRLGPGMPPERVADAG
jgi:DNA-binding HxlR family transcriptional regulator